MPSRENNLLIFVPKFEIDNRLEETQAQVITDLWEAGASIGFKPCHIKFVPIPKTNVNYLGIVEVGPHFYPRFRDLVSAKVLGRPLEERRYVLRTQDKDFWMLNDKGKKIRFGQGPSLQMQE